MYSVFSRERQRKDTNRPEYQTKLRGPNSALRPVSATTIGPPTQGDGIIYKGDHDKSSSDGHSMN